MAENSYFDSLVNGDDKYKFFSKDVGIKILSENLEFKISETNLNITNNIKELYNPRLEVTLLANLLYNVGYLRFKKPLKIRAKIKSGSDVFLSKNTRFTDGKDDYYLENYTPLKKEVEAEITLINNEIFTQSHKVVDATKYYHIPLNIHYRDLYKVVITKNGIALKYSQQFVSQDGEYSFEVLGDGKIQCCILMGNTNGNNIQLNDELKISIHTAPDTTIPPNNLTIMESGYDVVVPSIWIEEPYQKYLTIADMQDLIKYGRKNNGDIILNEDFKQNVIKNIAGIKSIKLWQEREESLEVGFNITNTNLVFCSYIGEADNVSLNDKIIKTIQGNSWGRPVIIKKAVIIDLSVNINIKTTHSLGKDTSAIIKKDIIGYYDDISNKISKEVVYKKVFKVLAESVGDFELTVSLSDKGAFKNRNFFNLKDDLILINYR